MSRERFPFPGLRPPSPPDNLRERVLRAARAATPGVSASFIDRIWESWRVRVVTAALYAVLLAFHFSIDFRTATKSVYSSPHAVADTQTRADGITIPDPRRGAAVQWRELAAELGMKERRWQAKGALE